ncbi:hypothetical protein J2I47_16875 [Fibrella sp. HMF5335]|uniref:Uncharacterized protein n=1 Tax=Fibrella rubiginis TaxID=2817060 RepID=A0A939K5X2_9BACT|nr:hypothetical protein [Fibrella rubiginis]MBO0938228.1 hypothetical protein [Fibrella rubiginis]
MTKRVDVAVIIYGKPYNTIVAIKTLLDQSRQHIDKIYLSYEYQQPHNDWGGLHKIIDYFKEDPVEFVIHRPTYFLAPDTHDVERTRTDERYRQSIMFQYALEKTDKPYLCVIHNDLLFHRDMIGDMLAIYDRDPGLTGIGSIGQCWSCPASMFYTKRCTSTTMRQYVPSKQEAIALHRDNNTLRKALDIEVIESGRVHPLPECRLNEYCALINIDIYRANTLPIGDVGCYGGGWRGADMATVFFHDMFNRGFRFQHIVLEEYLTHAAFDDSGSGSAAYGKAERYWLSEQHAREYIDATYPRKAKFGANVWLSTKWDYAKRNAWLMAIHTVGFAKRLVGRS